jgi:hypothetical protein
VIAPGDWVKLRHIAVLGFDCAFSPPGRALKRAMPMMRVTMLLDMHNKRCNYHRNMVSEVIGMDIARVPCPSHVAPSMSATMDVYPGPSRNDCLDLVVLGGTPTQI